MKAALLSPGSGPSRVVILTGAGISRESGLATFRDPEGIWAQVRLEDVATPEAFVRDPARVHAFYNARRRQLVSGQVQPNPAHLALAELGRRWPGRLLVVTQNVDDLHERAGLPAAQLLHLHGELLRARCARCGQETGWREDLDVRLACPACGQTGGLRPAVVWFGEVPLRLDEIAVALAGCQLFAAVGTSGQVYPAASFAAEARAAGAYTVELNLEPSVVAGDFDERIYGPASAVVPAFVRRLLGEPAD